MLGVTDARGVDRPAGLVMPLTPCLSHPFHPPPKTILNKMLGNAPTHCVSVCKCMCALGRSCQDLFICNTAMEVEALRFLNVGLLVDCIGDSKGGQGRRRGVERHWRDATEADESCYGNQSSQTKPCTHARTHTHTHIHTHAHTRTH